MTPAGQDETESMEVEGEEDVAQGGRRNSRAARHMENAVTPSGAATLGLQQPYTVSFLSHVSPTASTSGGVSIPDKFSTALPIRQHVSLSRDEAILVYHYSEHLGPLLDGSDPARQFTLRIPVEVKHCAILLYATVCFSARHIGNDATADRTYQRCIELLIEQLNLDAAAYDENILCAIVLLRFFEQLNVPSIAGSDSEDHLAGCSAILRASQTPTVDPSSPTLREAAFWVYVRQCLYNATINQQPPNIDFSLQLDPKPDSMRDYHPLAALSLETAWANQMTWHCACIVNFCFDPTNPQERDFRMKRWQELWDAVQAWLKRRPPSFDPIWYGEASERSVFPEVFFTAVWHGSSSFFNVRAKTN